MGNDSDNGESSGVGSDAGEGQGHGGGSSSDNDGGAGGGSPGHGGSGTGGTSSDAGESGGEDAGQGHGGGAHGSGNDSDPSGTGGFGGGSGGSSEDVLSVSIEISRPGTITDPAEQAQDQGRASEMESHLSGTNMSPDQISQAMQNFTSLSPAAQQAMLANMQSQSTKHSLSQRTYAAQLHAFAVQATVMGLRSTIDNVKGFGLSVARDVISTAIANTVSPAIGAVAQVSTVTQALGLNLAVNHAVNVTVDAIMDAAHTQAAKGITGLSTNAPMGDPSNSEGESSVLSLGLKYEWIIDKHGSVTLADGIDIAFTLMYGQLYRSRSNIIGSAYDPLRGLLLLR